MPGSFPPKLFFNSLVALAPDKERVDARATDIIASHPEYGYWLGYFAALITEYPDRLSDIEELFCAPANRRAAAAKKFYQDAHS